MAELDASLARVEAMLEGQGREIGEIKAAMQRLADKQDLFADCQADVKTITTQIKAIWGVFVAVITAIVVGFIKKG